MPARALLALLNCPLCSPPALLRAPVTLHCGHTFCAAHLASSSSPPAPRAPNAAPVLPTCPLPTCSSSSRAPTTFSHAPPLNVTINKLIDIITTPIPDDTSHPAFHDDPDDRTDSKYKADLGSDLEYLPLPPQSPSSAESSQLPSPTPREPDTSGRATPTCARSGSQPSPCLPPRKRRRRLHRRVSPARAPASPHRTDHDPQSRLEKELLTELTCQICFGLLSQPLTTPCQHPKLQVFTAPAARGVTQVKRQNAALTEFSPLSPVKHSAPMASIASAATSSPSASAKENVVPGAKTAQTTRKPLGPRSPSPPSSPVQTKAALTPATLRVRPSKENASADKENGCERDRKDHRRSQILRDVTSTQRQDENVFAPPLGATKRAIKAECSIRSVKGAVVTDTSKGSVQVRMKEWERKQLEVAECVKERLREAEDEREHEREQEQRAQDEREE
ncbi:hypothetical protein C2E23DRAFT_882230 [Lenzites betulinus]|nr:hypothetical protein C2E23DRAFT_882230 [Lenzites betulinus]